MHWKVLTQFPEQPVADAWEDFLRETAYATHYVTPNFFNDPYSSGVDKFAVLAMEGERVAAVATGSDSGKTVSCGIPVRPQTAFRMGSDRLDAMRALIGGIDEKSSKRSELIDIYSWEQVEGLEEIGVGVSRCEGEKSVVMLDLAKGADELFRGFNERRRTQLRKSEKKGDLTIKDLETDDEIAELYEIHKIWNEGKGHRPDPFEKYAAAMRQTGNRKVLIALYDGKIIAGSYYRFCPDGIVEYAANNSLAEYRKLHPNDMLGWRGIQWACAAGFLRLSLGASHPFLRRFGGEIVSAYRFRIDRTFLKRHEKKERFQSFALKTYQMLPDSARSSLKRVLGKG